MKTWQEVRVFVIGLRSRESKNTSIDAHHSITIFNGVDRAVFESDYGELSNWIR